MQRSGLIPLTGFPPANTDQAGSTAAGD
uniref:Uncharacterized protein n=1 Tax=Anguilla anguilla TaxID=7936 RepID=A0A0E9T687_ANGAN